MARMSHSETLNLIWNGERRFSFPVRVRAPVCARDLSLASQTEAFPISLFAEEIRGAFQEKRGELGIIMRILILMKSKNSKTFIVFAHNRRVPRGGVGTFRESNRLDVSPIQFSRRWKQFKYCRSSHGRHNRKMKTPRTRRSNARYQNKYKLAVIVIVVYCLSQAVGCTRSTDYNFMHSNFLLV